MENSDTVTPNTPANLQNATQVTNGNKDNVRPMVTATPTPPVRVTIPTTTTTTSTATSNLSKGLPNIQPKGNGNQPQILPKVDGQIPGPPGVAAGPNNVLIPQGIQHVLINGQLYPIIQTANGTHLLIQQPVGQVQQAGGKQVFTAQPIQLGSMPPGQALPATMTSQQQQVPLQSGVPIPSTMAQTNMPHTNQKFNQLQAVSHPQSMPPVSAVPVGVSQPPIQPPNSNFGAMQVANVAMPLQPQPNNMSLPSMVPVTNGPFLSSQQKLNSLPSTSAAMVQTPQTPLMSFPSGNTQVTVTPQTQQLLNKINEQIEILKRKQDLDAQGKKALSSLLQAQQHVMSNVRQQFQMYAQRAAPGTQPRLPNPQQQAFGGQMQPAGAASVPAPLQPPGPPVPPANTAQPGMMQAPQMLQPGLAQLSASADTSKKIVEPVPGGGQTVTANNIMNVIAAFSNVKVGTQIYNIQLMENQKKEFVEIMAKMPARAQHEFVVQQTNIILQNVFVRQQQQAQQQQAAGGLQPQPTTPKPQNTSRSRPGRGGRRRPASRGTSSPATTPVIPTGPLPSKPSVPAPQSRPAAPQITLPVPPQTNNIKTPSRPLPSAKKPKVPMFSSKRVSDRLLGQIQKDQEILVRQDYYKKPFLSARQVKERLLRYHLYYKSEPYKAYRVLQEETLYETTAHDKVLDKEELTDRLRPYLWKESMTPTDQTEDLLIAKLLLDDEKEAIDNDKLLAEQDIEMFKIRYTKPAKDPTPPPSPTPEPSPEPSPDPPPVQEPEEEYEKEASPEKLEAKPPSPNLPTYLQHKQHFMAEPEPDIIKRVKRATAREAREMRAAKRRSVYPEESELPKELRDKKRKRRRHNIDRLEEHDKLSRIHRNTSDDDDLDAQDEDEKENEEREEDDESPSVEITQGDVTLKFDYESSSPYSFIKQSDDPELSDHSLQPASQEKSVNNDKHSEHSHSDSEDELISIGTPPTPPTPGITLQHEPSTPVLPPTPTLDMDDPGLKSPPIITDHMTSSPIKISSMNYESNDGYGINTSYGRQLSTSIKTPELPMNNSGSGGSLNDSNDEDDEDMEVDVVNSSNIVPNDDSITENLSSPPQRPREGISRSNSASSLNDRNFNRQSSHESHGTFERQNSQTSSIDQYEQRQQSHDHLSQQQSVDDPEAADHSDYENSTDDGSETGGRDTPDDASERVSPESQTSGLESQGSAACEDNSENEDVDIESEGDDEPEKPLLSLKINKNRLINYQWPSREEVEEEEIPAEKSHPSIKLKIGDSIPPPIKLRIKKHSNDNWEAASSVSSYNTEVDNEAEQDTDEELEEPENGGVTVNWDNDAVDDGASEIGSEHTYNEDSQSGFNLHKNGNRPSVSSDEEEWANQGADNSYHSNMAENSNHVVDEDSNDGYNVENDFETEGEDEGEESGSEINSTEEPLQWDATTYTGTQQAINEDSVPFAHYASYPSISGNEAEENEYEYDE